MRFMQLLPLDCTPKLPAQARQPNSWIDYYKTCDFSPNVGFDCHSLHRHECQGIAYLRQHMNRLPLKNGTTQTEWAWNKDMTLDKTWKVWSPTRSISILKKILVKFHHITLCCKDLQQVRVPRSCKQNGVSNNCNLERPWLPQRAWVQRII